MAAVLIAAYLNGISHTTPIPTDSYIESYNKTQVEAEAVVISRTDKETYIQLILDRAKLVLKENKDISAYDIMLIANISDVTIKPGDKVHIEGEATAFDNARNEGDFDSKIYYRSLNIRYKINAKKIYVMDSNSYNMSDYGNVSGSQTLNDNKTSIYDDIRHTFRLYQRKLYYKLYELKERFKSIYSDISDSDDAGIFISMVLGDKSMLDGDIREMYQKNGISHLLAISGLHISLIGMTIYSILRKSGISFIKAVTAASSIIICYGIMTGNAISTKRAVIMLIISLTAQVLGRTYDIMTSLSLAAIILIYDNPYVIENSAFQLSFGAVIGISLVYPSLKYTFSYILKCIKDNFINEKITEYNNKKNVHKIIKYIVKYLTEAFLFSISVNIVTLPVVLYNYSEFPPYGIFLNMAVIPLMSLLMLCSLLAAIAGLFNITAGTFMIGVSHYILRIYDILCSLTQRLKYSVIVTGRPSVERIIIYYMIIFIFIIIVIVYENFITIYTQRFNNITMNDNIKISDNIKIDERFKICDRIRGSRNIKEADNIKIYNSIKNNNAINFNMYKDNNGKYYQRSDVVSKNHAIVKNIIIDNVLKGAERILIYTPVMLIISCIILFYKEPCGFEVNMLDVGQGDGIVVRLPDNSVYMFDGGSTDIKEVGKYRIMPFLKARAITKLDCITISHSDADHINGVIELINMTDKTFTISNIILPDIKNKSEDKSYCKLENAALQHGINVEYIKAGDYIYKGRVAGNLRNYDNKNNDTWQIDNESLSENKTSERSINDKYNTVIKCVHPTPDYDYSCPNDYSASYMISYGKYKMLMMGDAQETAEKYMLDNNRLCDISVLKTGHHGSSTSSSDIFLDKIKPEAAIISCGINNRYHHPSEKVMERLHEKNIKAIVTSEHGQIKIRSDGESFTIN